MMDEGSTPVDPRSGSRRDERSPSTGLSADGDGELVGKTMAEGMIPVGAAAELAATDVGGTMNAGIPPVDPPLAAGTEELSSTGSGSGSTTGSGRADGVGRMIGRGIPPVEPTSGGSSFSAGISGLGVGIGDGARTTSGVVEPALELDGGGGGGSTMPSSAEEEDEETGMGGPRRFPVPDKR